MQLVDNKDSFEQLLGSNTFVLAYFSGEGCSVCSAMKPRVERLREMSFPQVNLVEIRIEKLPELAAQHTIFTIPAVLFFVDGREFIREVRIIDLHSLEQKILKILDIYSS
jgi:thioredoxin-like negative regulator of GroEL